MWRAVNSACATGQRGVAADSDRGTTDQRKMISAIGERGGSSTTIKATLCKEMVFTSPSL